MWAASGSLWVLIGLTGVTALCLCSDPTDKSRHVRWHVNPSPPPGDVAALFRIPGCRPRARHFPMPRPQVLLIRTAGRPPRVRTEKLARNGPLCLAVTRAAARSDRVYDLLKWCTIYPPARRPPSAAAAPDDLSFLPLVMFGDRSAVRRLSGELILTIPPAGVSKRNTPDSPHVLAALREISAGLITVAEASIQYDIPIPTLYVNMRRQGVKARGRVGMAGKSREREREGGGGVQFRGLSGF